LLLPAACLFLMVRAGAGEGSLVALSYLFLFTGGVFGGLFALRAAYLAVFRRGMGKAGWKFYLLLMPGMFISCIYLYALLMFTARI
jgi:hypothetical protein